MSQPTTGAAPAPSQPAAKAPIFQNQTVYAIREVMEPRLVRGFGRLFENLDWDGCRYAGGWLGLFLYGALGDRRNIAVQNVRLALGVSRARANQISRRSCMNFGMTFAEFMHLRVVTPEQVRERSWIEGLEYVNEAFARGKGAILLTGHLGNWEIMGARATQEFPMWVIGRPTSNTDIQRHIESAREPHNLHMISSWDDGRVPLRLLRDNRALAILPDQYAGRDGLMLPFFGHPTRIWSSVARLSLMSGAMVVPGFGVRRTPFLADGRIVAQVSPGWNVEKGAGSKADAIVEGTKRMAAEHERIIRAYPEQWLWLHRRWREKDGVVFPK